MTNEEFDKLVYKRLELKRERAKQEGPMRNAKHMKAIYRYHSYMVSSLAVELSNLKGRTISRGQVLRSLRRLEAAGKVVRSEMGSNTSLWAAVLPGDERIKREEVTHETRVRRAAKLVEKLWKVTPKVTGSGVDASLLISTDDIIERIQRLGYDLDE